MVISMEMASNEPRAKTPQPGRPVPGRPVRGRGQGVTPASGAKDLTGTSDILYKLRSYTRFQKYAQGEAVAQTSETRGLLLQHLITRYEVLFGNFIIPS